jgi:aminoglycoside 6'-N-acetyltransferase I
VIQLRTLRTGDDAVLRNVADGVFDADVRPELVAEVLADPRHHLVVAVDDGVVVGMASGIHYVHPDKPPELWINEVGVAPTHRNRGIARAVVEALLNIARSLNCREAWVLTDDGNPAAMRAYQAAGGVRHPVDQVMFEFRLQNSQVSTEGRQSS